MNYISIILDIIITFMAYTTVPFITFNGRNQTWTKKEIKIINLINSVIISISFYAVRNLLKIETINWNVAPAVFYFFVNNYIWLNRLKKGKMLIPIVTKSKKHMKGLLLLISIILIFGNIIFNTYKYLECENVYKECQTYEQYSRELRERLNLCPTSCTFASANNLSNFLKHNIFLLLGILLIILTVIKDRKKSIVNKYDDLKKLKELLDLNVITQEEYETEKEKVLK